MVKGRTSVTIANKTLDELRHIMEREYKLTGHRFESYRQVIDFLIENYKRYSD